MASTIIHVLRGGFPLCGFDARFPMFWPEGHFWVAVNSAVDPKLLEVTCVECAAKISADLREG